MRDSTPALAPLVEFAGHLMKRCRCGALFNAERLGAECRECAGPSADDAEWVSISDDLWRSPFPGKPRQNVIWLDDVRARSRSRRDTAND